MSKQSGDVIKPKHAHISINGRGSSRPTREETPFVAPHPSLWEDTDKRTVAPHPSLREDPDGRTVAPHIPGVLELVKCRRGSGLVYGPTCCDCLPSSSLHASSVSGHLQVV